MGGRSGMYFVLRTLCRLITALPLSVALSLGRGVGNLAYLLVRRHRESVLAEMARCFPGDSESVLKDRLQRVFQHIGMNYMEVFRWIGGKVDELEGRITLEGAEHVEAARACGRGVLVLIGHIGNWDLMGLWAARHYPLTIISKSLRNEGVNRFWMEARARTGLNIVPARKSYRACLGVMKKNGLLGFILDQNTLRKDGVFVEFYGKEACTSPGLAFLSAHAQAPVVPVFMFRQPDGTHRIQAMPMLDPPPDREPATIVEATQRYTRIIEDAIRRHPDQWIWMHRRWRTVRPVAVPVPVLAGSKESEESS